MVRKDLDRFRKMIVEGRHFGMSAEDREFVGSKDLSSDDMLRIFKITALPVLGLKVVAWLFDHESDETTVWYE